MDFQAKNFTYAKIPFGEFVNRIEQGEPLYLRSLSQEQPARKATHLATDFAAIVSDFKLPTALAEVYKRYHSSPLRVSGPVKTWLHYDVGPDASISLLKILIKIR